jgi:hypothetical protein
MVYAIALIIIIFRIAVAILFGYAYHWSKPGRSKTTVLLSFIGYWLSNSIIVLLYYIQRGLERAYLSRMSSVTSLEACLEEIQFGFIELFPFPIFPFFSKIVVLGILALILTVNFLHFIYTFIYTGVFGVLWAKFLRKRKEDEFEVVYTDNSQMEDSSKVESPENSQDENRVEDVSKETNEDNQNNNLPPDNNKEKLYAILKELFKK